MRGSIARGGNEHFAQRFCAALPTLARMNKSAVWMMACAIALGCAGSEPDDSCGNVAGSAGVAGSMNAGTTAPPLAGASGTSAGNVGSGGAMPDAAAPSDAAAPADSSTALDAAVQSDAASDSGEPDATREGWALTFRDEFDEPAGTGVDTAKWTPVNKGDGFGNNELQFYTDRTDNARTDGDGSLIIEVREESYMGREYTSARLESIDTFVQTYGRFEIRAKLPFGQGIWPAFWLLGNDIGEVSWPACGEIDIMEHVGRTPSTNYGSLHGPGYSGGNPLSEQYMLENGARFADDFHEYAVEWEPDVVRWYVDENLYETRTPADVPQGGEWVYDHPFFMILNVAVGGAFPGSPDDTTTFPQRLLVDYVRVYERDM